jgi:hypothetical protein
MSAVTPAPDEGSKPAIVKTTGGAEAIDEMYRKASHYKNISAELELHHPRNSLNQNRKAVISSYLPENKRQAIISRCTKLRLFTIM